MYTYSKDIKPIEGFHAMEFVRKARKRIAKETKGMTPEERVAYINAKPSFLGEFKPYKPSQPTSHSPFPS